MEQFMQGCVSGELALAASAFSATAVIVDHRLHAWDETDVAGYVRRVSGTADLIEHMSIVVTAVPIVTECGMLMGVEIIGRTSEGADIRNPRWTVLAFDGELIKRVHRFDADEFNAGEELLVAVSSPASSVPPSSHTGR
jgi:hypothetical protein